jgi:hypothetical protein
MICSSGLELTFPGIEGDWHPWKNCTGGYTGVKIKMTEIRSTWVGIHYIASTFISGNLILKNALLFEILTYVKHYEPIFYYF